MTPEEVFDAWAPSWSRWSAWVKPVLFAHVDVVARIANVEGFEALLPPVDWVPPADGASVLVVDLPDAQGVLYGLLLAERGYRPVPLYNSVPVPAHGVISTHGTGLVDMSEVVAALAQNAERLNDCRVPPDAPPAFLLDARRRMGSGDRRPGMFDNRSISLPTDFPSANLLIASGAREVIVIQQSGTLPQEDLAHTLRRWQEAGMQIRLATSEAPGQPRPITIPRPPRFRHTWYNFLARIGLRRNPLGGFGGFIPVPSEGGGYRGFG